MKESKTRCPKSKKPSPLKSSTPSRKSHNGPPTRKKRSNRPVFGVAISISIAIAAPAIAGIYMILSPLGKEYAYDISIDEEAQIPMTAPSASMNSIRSNSLEKRLSFLVREDGQIIEN